MSFVNSSSSTVMHFSEQQQMIQESARSFCQANSSIPQVRAFLGQGQGYQEEVWKEITQLGWSGICVKEADGGSGLGLEALIPIAEAMGRHLLATPFICSNIATQILLRAERNSQRQLSQIAKGAIITLALLDNEDWGGSHGKVQLKNGKLQGHKCMVEYANNADLFLVSCSNQGQAAIAIIEAKQLDEGAITQHTLIDETKRSAQVDFSGVTVNADQLIIGESVPMLITQAKLAGALLTAAEAVGAASACLDLTVEYLKTRKQFGQLIGSYQSLKHPAVDILNQMEGAKSQIYHAASLLEDSLGEFTQDIEIACRMSKASANDALLFAGDRAVQFHGGMGFTYECDAQLYIRRAQWSQQHYGDSAHHRKRLAPLLLPL